MNIKKHNRIYTIKQNLYGNIIYKTDNSNWIVTKFNEYDDFIKTL